MKIGRSRIAEEQAAVLAGKTRNKDDSAVRWGELPAAVAKIVDAILKAKSDVVERMERMASFRFSGSLIGGLYSWAVGDTEYPPSVGQGGGALWLPRNNDGRVGTWIAADAGGSDNQPRLFASATSGTPGDWSRFFEILTMAGLLKPVAFEGGYPSGGAQNIIQNANGRAYRFASGLQICVQDALPAFTFSTADVLRAAWTFPAPFIAAPRPLVFPILPSVVGASHVDVDPVGIGYGFANMTDPASTFVSLRRSYGAPAFISTSSVSGGGAIAIGLWGTP